MENNKKLSKIIRRTVTGALAVVTAATAMGPLFTVISHADTASFDYIETLKDSLEGRSYNIVEIAPSSKQTAMGYLAAGNEPLDLYSKDAATVEGWKKADRASYMSGVYSGLGTKGIVGTSNAYPITKSSTDGYKEYYPWQVTETSENVFYYNGDLNAGVPNEGAKPVKELEILTEDSDTIKGRFEATGTAGTGDYKLNASYSISQKKFFYNEFAQKYSNSSWLLSDRLTNTAAGNPSGNNLNFNSADKSISVSTGNSTLLVHTQYTTLNKNNLYFMEVEKDTEYELSFHVEVNNGGKFYVSTYEASSGSLQTLIGTSTVNFIPTYTSSSDSSVDESQSGTYKIIIKTSKLTDLTKKLYLQLCFGVDKTKNTTATFSDIYFGEPRGFEQDTDRFIYETESYTDTDNDFWYDLDFVPIAAADYDTRDFEGVAFYQEQGVESSGGSWTTGNGIFECIGVAGVDDEIDLDYQKAMAGLYYTAKIKEDVYDDDGNGLQTVSKTRDQYHPYRAEPKFEDGTTDLKFKSSSKGYFKAEDKTYTFTEGTGDYIFVPDSSATESIRVYTNKVYYRNDLTNNDFFKYYALDYNDAADNFSVDVTCVSPETIAGNLDYFISRINAADMIVISAGTGLQVNASLDTVSFGEDISLDIRNSVIEVMNGSKKTPVIVDARLINSTFANAVSETQYPVLYSLINEIADRLTENFPVSIKNGGVTSNIYVFNPADINSSVASIATKDIAADIVTGKSGNSYTSTSPFYDVYYQINYEKTVRTAHSLPSLPRDNVCEATCMRCIINYVGRRIMGNKSKLRVLDIEPYTNIPSISELDIAGWLPNGYFRDSDNLPVSLNSANVDDYIELTCMSTAELNGTSDLIIENYDLVYVGVSFENFNDPERINGQFTAKYNDDSPYMENKIYTGIGDTHTVGNINYDGSNLGDILSGTIEGNTLAGLLRVDYTQLIGSTWMVNPGYEFGLRTTGNDITRDVMNQLKEFAETGFPVVFADDLVTGKSDESYSMSVTIESKNLYRATVVDWEGKTTNFNDYHSSSFIGIGDNQNTEKAQSGTDAVYYTFLKATLNGNIPIGVIPEFTWHWRRISDGATGAMDLSEEPISKKDVTTADGTAKNWYATVGDWDYQGNYKDNNGDSFITGLAMPGGQDYQKTVGEYAFYCDVTFSKDPSVNISPNNQKMFIDYKLTLHSNEITYSSKNVTFTISGSRASNGDLEVSITPNPRIENVAIFKKNWRHRNKGWLGIWGSWGDCSDDNNVIENSNSRYKYKQTCGDDNLGLELWLNCTKDKDKHMWGYAAKNGSYSNQENHPYTTRVIKTVNRGGSSIYFSPPPGLDTSAFFIQNGVVHVDNSAFKQVNMRTVDNTSFLYQFMSDVYNIVEYSAAERAANPALVNKMTRENVFKVSDFPSRSTDLMNSLIDETPSVSIDKSSLTSYPYPLPDRNIEFNFTVYSDKNSNGAQYEVKFFIDSDHDAVFNSNEEVSVTYMRAKTGAAPTTNSEGRYVVTSSTSSYTVYNEYTIQKTLPSSYVGIIPWKIVVTDVNNPNYHDSEIGYAYRKAGVGEGTVIKALQILPADHWSNTVREIRNSVNEVMEKYDYPIVRGMWRPGYNEDKKRFNTPEEGNAYVGSVFLGTGAGRGGTIYKDDPNINYDHENEAWYLKDKNDFKDPDKTNLIYTYTNDDFNNDAFYQLCLGSDSILDRTVYYEDVVDTAQNADDNSEIGKLIKEAFGSLMQYNKVKYRTHVELWVNPSGSKIPKTDAQGNVLTDFFGNTIYCYEQYDFELDIALTDIYEMDFCWYQNASDVETNAFLNQFDMLIMGFGDSYGKTARQNKAGINVAKANLGFNLYAAQGIRKYVDSGRPVLFCHDTTNGNVNFIDYFGLNALSWLANIGDTVEHWWDMSVRPAIKKAWYWVRNVVRSVFNMPKLEVPSPSHDQEEELDNRIADSRVRDGYYNNLILRYPLKLDRYGITYTICEQMDKSNGWAQNNFRVGHAFSYLTGNGSEVVQRDDDGKPRVNNGEYVTAWEPFNSFEYQTSNNSQKVVDEVELLAHGFTLAQEPGSALTYAQTNARGDTIIQYNNYNNANGGTKMVDGEPVAATFTGQSVKASSILDTQGFTKWAIARYLANGNSDAYMPMTVPGATNGKHRDPYITSAITQVNKGSITCYPYDVNTSEFEGSADPLGDGKIPIMPTHDQFYQTSLNDGKTTVWYCLADNSNTPANKKTYDLLPNDCVNSYYIYTSGNVTYTGAGHANIFNEAEAKLFINTLVSAFRAAKEKPSVHFRDETNSANISYQTLVSNNRKESDGDKTVEKAISAVKVIDPNLNNAEGTQLHVNFYSDGELKNSINIGTLYAENNNGSLGGESVTSSSGSYNVKTDVTYYFETPAQVLEALKDNESYTLYAVASVSGETSDPMSLEYRRLGLADLT